MIAGASKSHRRVLAQPAASAPLALELARKFNRIAFARLPPKAIDHAKMIVASTLASAASGFSIGSAQIVRALAKEQGGRPEASLWFEQTKLPVAHAARVNAMSSDAAASDDSDLRNIAHTGTCLTAVALALAERIAAGGAEVITAIVAGYQAAGRIGAALGERRNGFHASVIVAFGGAVAAAKLLKLSDDQMAHAISLTATTMGGLTIGTNSWAREYHAGNAALCAVNAAQAAGRGYKVNEDMLEARGGFFEVFGGDKASMISLARETGQDWDIVNYLAIKLAPGAHALHATAEAAVNAAQQANVPPEEIAEILVSGPGSRDQTVSATIRPPKDRIEAIHSVAYFVASAVADKEFSWVHATDQKLHRPVVDRLIPLVRTDPAPPPVHYGWNWGGAVAIVTKSGARFASTVEAPRGSGPRGIAWRDIDAKFRALFPNSGLPAPRIEEILRRIHEFDQVRQASDFTRLLR